MAVTQRPPREPSTGGSAAVPPAARARRSTPASLRLLLLAVIVACGLFALTSLSAARALTTGADRARDHTGPVLVATQDVVASIAEADAASAAVFLSGTDEDRQQRRLYELALERASRQLEQVSRLVGDDPADHAAVQDIGADLVRYAGLVERARLSNAQALPGGTDLLLEAIDIVQGSIVPRMQTINDRAAGRLEDDISAGGTELVVALVVGLATLALLGATQSFLLRRTNRILNPPLVLATVLIVVTSAWLLTAWNGRQDDLAAARDGGYASIELTASIQTTAFRYKTLESTSLLGGSAPASTPDPGAAARADLADRLAGSDIDDAALTAARDGRPGGSGLLFDAARAADSDRERAAATEMLERWARSVATSRTISAAVAAGERAVAIDIATGAGNADFNGFNTSVESVLSDNRTQFTDGLGAARDRLSWLRAMTVTLPLLAALVAAWGLQLRIREYRR